MTRSQIKKELIKLLQNGLIVPTEDSPEYYIQELKNAKTVEDLRVVIDWLLIESLTSGFELVCDISDELTELEW